MYLHDLVRSITVEILKELQGRSDKLSFLVLAKNTPETVVKLREKLGSDAVLAFFDEAGVGVAKRYIIPVLSCNGMADLAMGKASDQYLSAALHLLFEGKNVEVLEFEYTSYSETAPFALYELYASYEKTLLDYGLTTYTAKPVDAIYFRESLVTAQTITETHKSGASTLMVSTRAIITPLAFEAAKGLNITILKQL